MVIPPILALSTILICNILFVNTLRQTTIDANYTSLALLPLPNGYALTFHLGSRYKEFNVMVTLSNSMFWIPCFNCTNCGSRRKYDPSAQHYFHQVGTNWTLKTWHGTVNGVLGEDSVKSVSERNSSFKLIGIVAFGMATNMAGHEDLYADGMLGLSNAPTGAANKPFIYQLRENWLTLPWFVIEFNPKSPSWNVGWVHFGWYEGRNCNCKDSSVMSYKSLQETPYLFKVGISMGSFSPRFLYFATPELIPDITGPPELIAGIVTCAGAKYINGYYEVNCNDTETIPDLMFTYGPTSFYITSDNLIRKTRGRCALALAIQSGTAFGPEVYLGAPLFKQYCVGVDFSHSDGVIVTHFATRRRNKRDAIATTISFPKTCKIITSSASFTEVTTRLHSSLSTHTGYTSPTSLLPTESTQSTHTTEATSSGTKLIASNFFAFLFLATWLLCFSLLNVLKS